MKLDKKDVTPMRASTRREHAVDHRAITICHKDKKRGRLCIINAAAKNAIKSHSQAKEQPRPTIVLGALQDHSEFSVR